MSHITPGHVRAFQMVRSPLYENISLASCTINGEPGVAIIVVEEAGENKLAVMPLFVAINDNMAIDFPDMQRESHGGGPKKPRGAAGKYDELREPK